MCECDYKMNYFELYISKINKDGNTKFYAQCQTSAQIKLPGFDENLETGSVVELIGSEYLKND